MRWTKDAALAALRHYAQRLGKTPGESDLRVAPRGIPRDRTFYRLFGSLREAQRLAGLAPNPLKGPRKGTRYGCRRGHPATERARSGHCRACSAGWAHRHGVPVPVKRCPCGTVLRGRPMKCTLCKRSDQLAGRPRKYWAA